MYWADKPTQDLSDVLAEGIKNGRPREFPLRPLGVIGILVGLVALGVGLLAFTGFFSRSPQTVPTTTFVVPTTLPVITTAAPTTTSAPTTSVAPTTTTAAPTTTSTSSTSTTAPPPHIEPVGEPLALDALRLSVAGIGPLGFGDPADGVLGVFAASLGQPDADSGTFASLGEWGTCPGDIVRGVQWGPFTAVTRWQGSMGEVFYGFRLDGRVGGESKQAGALQTASGLRLGSTVTDLESMFFGTFDVVLGTSAEDGADTFELRDGGNLILWGPISAATPDGTVLGIFSPMGCPG